MTMIPCMVPKIWSIADSFLLFWTICLPFYYPNNPENQNFEKMRKTPADIILHMYTINNNHMMYGAWGMDWGGQNVLSFLTIFCHFLLSNNPKSQNFENIKKPQEISFCTSVPKIIIICCVVAEIWLITDLISIFHFGLFFALNPPNNQKNQHF